MPSLHNHSQGGGVPLVHVWLDPTNARQVLDKGFKAIHNTGQNFYLVRTLTPAWWRYDEAADQIGLRARGLDFDQQRHR